MQEKIGYRGYRDLRVYQISYQAADHVSRMLSGMIEKADKFSK
jgi:hypothetical protein